MRGSRGACRPAPRRASGHRHRRHVPTSPWSSLLKLSVRVNREKEAKYEEQCRPQGTQKVNTSTCLERQADYRELPSRAMVAILANSKVNCLAPSFAKPVTFVDPAGAPAAAAGARSVGRLWPTREHPGKRGLIHCRHRRRPGTRCPAGVRNPMAMLVPMAISSCEGGDM